MKCGRYDIGPSGCYLVVPSCMQETKAVICAKKLLGSAWQRDSDVQQVDLSVPAGSQRGYLIGVLMRLATVGKRDRQSA